ncbi:hypothetical protein MLD38_036079 [Melastoma candidum]|uniref:Uncharacterized protein n=1 Tax=Melastoma candidum TaxID=119954 RepID=A0ACB9LHY9_9MYRT|nr:hypothetical protein MLD38_036079 [Melastoma candidum]
MESQVPCGQPYGSNQPQPPPQQMMKISSNSDNERTTNELRALDCNLTSLCDHIQSEGFDSGAFSDISVQAMGSTYRLHRLIVSRSSYFRNMLHGPWKEASAPVVTLNVDDKNVNPEAIATALAYLYGHLPKLNVNNAFRVLAAASFLDLQDLCSICTDFIISELWTSNFLAYQVFAESQDYGIHGERVRTACWGYLCQSGAVELKEVLPKLSSSTLHALLTSDELWVPSEEKRFELALFTLLAKAALQKVEVTEQALSNSDAAAVSISGSSEGTTRANSSLNKGLKSDLGNSSLPSGMDGSSADHGLLVELADGSGIISYGSGSTSCIQQSFADREESNIYVATPVGISASVRGPNESPMEGPSEDCSFYNSAWLTGDPSGHCSAVVNPSCYGVMQNEWGRSGVPGPSWGGRVVARRQMKSSMSENCGICGEDYDAFVDIFEGGSLLYCNMPFDALINVRKQLEELGFPCKSINDSLWLQMLLSQRVQEIGTNTCRNCCLLNIACACRQPIGFSPGISASGYYIQEQELSTPSGHVGSVFVTTEATQGSGDGPLRPVRVHVRGPADGLAGIGRGNQFVPVAGWTPTRFVFSRVPFGTGNRNGPQSLGNDESEARAEQSMDLAGDGLTALVGLSQGMNNVNTQGDHSGSGYEADLNSRLSGASAVGPSGGAVSVQMLDHSGHDARIGWDNAHGSHIALDMKTPLSHFPPFRFGVEFQDVHRLSDGQVKHSPEVFYAGSLWKVSVQAFNDEDPQGRRTLGLFLHRRKAESTADPLRKVSYVDSREKVSARYQLICPSKREVMVFGSYKQRGTLLPKAPKGWGWRTALLFDELPELIQNGALRIAAVVQLV